MFLLHLSIIMPSSPKQQDQRPTQAEVHKYEAAKLAAAAAAAAVQAILCLNEPG